MTEINTRPAFFPNSSSNTQTSKIKSPPDFSNEISESRGNSPSRMDELKSTTAEHARVDIPDSIKDYSVIKKAVDNSKPVDNSEKIAALKARIQAGTYEIDDEAVANKMLTSEF